MDEQGNTRGWFALGLGLIIIGGGIYALLTLAGIGFAFHTVSEESGAPIWAIMFVPGLVLLGFAILLAKVVVDRLNNEEDDHYSRTVDK